MDKKSGSMSEREYRDQIQKLRARMKDIDEHKKDALSKIFGILIGSEHRYIKKCIIMFEKEMAEISRCFDFCLIQRDYFVMQILNRAFIEALFRYLYITLSFLKTSNDKEARDFTEILSISETYTMLNKFRNVLKKIGQLENDNDFYEIISDKKISKSEMREVSDRYAFANIILELNNYYTDYNPEDSNSPLIKYILKYSMQSSFMHGGPGAQLRHLFEKDNHAVILENYKFLLNSMQLVHLYMYYCGKKIDKNIADKDIRIEIEFIE
jgi:hypothetical protein